MSSNFEIPTTAPVPLPGPNLDTTTGRVLETSAHNCASEMASVTRLAKDAYVQCYRDNGSGGRSPWLCVCIDGLLEEPVTRTQDKFYLRLLKDLLMSRLDGEASLSRWVLAKVGESNDLGIDDSVDWPIRYAWRVQWLDALIKEFEANSNQARD